MGAAPRRLAEETFLLAQRFPSPPSGWWWRLVERLDSQLADCRRSATKSLASLPRAARTSVVA